MVEKKKRFFTKKEFLTAAEFAEKYGKDDKKMVGEVFTVLHKRGTQITNEYGNTDNVIYKDRGIHTEPYCYKIHPLYHDIALKAIKAKKAKGAVK